MAVMERASDDVPSRLRRLTQCLHELVEEHRDAVLAFCLDGNWKRPRSRFRPASRDDFFAVRGDEVIEHHPRLSFMPETTGWAIVFLSCAARCPKEDTPAANARRRDRATEVRRSGGSIAPGAGWTTGQF